MPTVTNVECKLVHKNVLGDNLFLVLQIYSCCAFAKEDALLKLTLGFICFLNSSFSSDAENGSSNYVYILSHLVTL